MQEDFICLNSSMNLGAAPEVIADGKTGFVCTHLEECVAAVTKVCSLSRQECRHHAEAKFSVQHMVDGYEAVYHRVLAERVVRNGHVHSAQLLAAKGRVA